MSPPATDRHYRDIGFQEALALTLSRLGPLPLAARSPGARSPVGIRAHRWIPERVRRLEAGVTVRVQILSGFPLQSRHIGQETPWIAR